jgi:hypothetical protein
MKICDVNNFINTSLFEVLWVDFFTQELLCNFSKDRRVIKEAYSQDSCVRLLVMFFLYLSNVFPFSVNISCVSNSNH